MQLSLTDAAARGRARMRHELIEARLRRYRPELKAAVTRLANRHGRLADLVLSFPALLAALASPRAHFNAEPAISHVIAGDSLAVAARSAKVAMWLRKLPPESIPRPVPELPDSERFRREIGNYLPRSSKSVPVWLDLIAKAADWADDAFALWLARELPRDPKRGTVYRLQLMSLWAWFSLRPQTCGHSLLESLWRPSMQFAKAMEGAQQWRATVKLHLELASRPVDDIWLEPATVDGYDFVPLRSYAEILQEAQEMRNCLRGYGYDVAHNRSRLWSVRREGQRVATLETALRGREPLLEIYELKGPTNRTASAEVWLAACRWLHSHDLLSLDTRTMKWDAAILDRSTWFTLWRPYWIAKQRIPSWLPLSPSRDALDAL